MSVFATSWAKRQRTGDATLKSVLIAIADYADEHGVCWPSQERIALDTELSERSIRRALKALETGGLITRRKRVGHNTGLRQTDVITLKIDLPDNLAGGQSSTGHTGQNHRPQRPLNHHRNHHRSPIQGTDVSGRGSGGRRASAPPHVDGGEVGF